MLYEAEVNVIQALIVRRLYKHETLRFAQINQQRIPSDQFSYHLRYLQKVGIIAKTTDGAYALTTTGRLRAQFLAPRSSKFIEQGFMAVRVLLTRHQQGSLQVLLHKRNEVPQRSLWAAPGGKILFGDTVAAAAETYMHYQTGLHCRVVQKGLVHYLDEYDGRVVQDKYFLVFQATLVSGTLLENGPRGTNAWLDYGYLANGPDVIGGLREMTDVAMGDNYAFREQTFKITDF